jgi:hypothetical protein
MTNVKRKMSNFKVGATPLAFGVHYWVFDIFQFSK